MKKIFLLITITILGSLSLIAQNNDTKKADKHFARFQFVEAAEEYAELVEDGKGGPYVYAQLAESYYNIFNTVEAERWYAKALETSSEDAEMIYKYSQMLKANGNLLYINEPIVLCRMDNDSFSSEGIVKRFKIDYLGYSEIANALFASNHKILNSMLKVLTREHRFARLLKIKFHCIDESEWDDVKNHIKIFGYPNHTLYLVELLSIFRPIIFILLRLNKFFKGKKLTRFKKID